MNITEKEFTKMPQIEREKVIFRNTETIIQKQRKIEIHQKVQYIILTGVGIALSILFGKL